MIVPFMTGLATEMHHRFGLNSFGFRSSLLKRFEISAARYQGTDILVSPQVSLVQTMPTTILLDDQNTFHGIMAAVTPGNKRQMPVLRCSATSADVGTAGNIDIHFYKKLLNHR